MVQVITPL